MLEAGPLPSPQLQKLRSSEQTPPAGTNCVDLCCLVSQQGKTQRGHNQVVSPRYPLPVSWIYSTQCHFFGSMVCKYGQGEERILLTERDQHLSQEP